MEIDVQIEDTHDKYKKNYRNRVASGKYGERRKKRAVSPERVI